MGDRGNIIVQDNKDKVYLYTHWTGSELPKIIKKALSRRERWDDYQYLTRILFCEMIDGDTTGATGYGISSTPHDGGNDIIVDVDKQTVNNISFEKYIQKKEYAKHL